MASLDMKSIKKAKKKKKDKKKKKPAQEDADSVDDIWIDILSLNKVWGYMLPPRRSAGGLFAKSWGLEQHDWTGNLLLKTKDNNLMLVFMNKDGTLFAQTPCIPLDKIGPNHPLTTYVEPVQDSSRYFGVPIRDPGSGRTASFGFGFEREGNRAFDFNAAINDQLSMVRRHNQMDEKQLQADLPQSNLPQPVSFADQFAAPEEEEPEKEYDLTPLGEGGMEIKLGSKFLEARAAKKKKKKKKKHRQSDIGVLSLEGLPSVPGGPSSSGGLMLAPPPSDNMSNVDVSSNAATASTDDPAPPDISGLSVGGDDDDDDWGDFETAF